MPKVVSTKEFDTWEHLLEKNYKKEIDNIIEQLKTNIDVGKPLRYPFFREKKFDKYRIYFLVYEDIDTILLITISDKKAQQKTIDRIIGEFSQYNEMIRKNL